MLSVVALLTASPSSAQITLPSSPKCEGIIFVDSIYQQGRGGNNYEYYIQLRNGSDKPVNWGIEFGGFSSATVQIDHPNPRTGRLNAYSSTTIKFGKGTDGNINRGTVGLLFDSEFVIGNPHVNVKGCF